jgi:hypothetical protein
VSECLLQGNKLFCAWTNTDAAALNFIVRAYKSVPAPTGNPLPAVRCNDVLMHLPTHHSQDTTPCVQCGRLLFHMVVLVRKRI